MGFDGAWNYVKPHLGYQLKLPRICGMIVLPCQHQEANVHPNSTTNGYLLVWLLYIQDV
jgi:hypothetical protein